MKTGYADESGDAGYEFSVGSSDLFTLVVVIPHDPESLINRIVEARRKLRKPETFEFHFRQATENICQTFFESVAPEKLILLAATIHKANAGDVLQRTGKTGLYIHALSGLALRSPIPLNNIKLHLDGTGSQKEFIQSLKNGVRNVCREAGQREQNFKDIRLLNSTHTLIQCADMFAGAVAQQAESKQSVWLNLIRFVDLIWWEEKFAI